MIKPNRLIYLEGTPEGGATEGAPESRDRTRDFMAISGFAKDRDLTLVEKPKDSTYECREGGEKGKIVCHIHYAEDTGHYTLVGHSEAGENLLARGTDLAAVIEEGKEKM